MDDDTPAVAPEPQSAPRYGRVMAAISQTPWALMPETLAAILDLAAFRAQGGRLTKQEIQARIGAGPARRGAYPVGNVAVLPLYGVLIPRATVLSEMSGGTSVQGFAKAFRAAVADEDVGSILIDVHSPGGAVDLIPELAAEIRNARGTKPIVAIANTLCCSAAYHIASQADEFVSTVSGLVGSIGVYAAHEDWSKFDEMVGVKTTLIAAGKYKVEGNPFEPLDEEARAAIQHRVDEFYKLFVNDVAKGRGVSATKVRGGFGEGRVMTARDALAEGMVDRIESYEATLARLLRGKGTTRQNSASAAEDEAAVELLEEAALELLEDTPAGAGPPGARPAEDDDGSAALAVSLVALAQDIRRTTRRNTDAG